MSKRKQTLTNQILIPSGVPTAIDIFRQANTTFHEITVSTPILVIVQRLTTDAKFREAVTRLFK